MDLPEWVQNYDRDGNPVTFEEFGRLVGDDPEYCDIAVTTVGDVSVSTVLLPFGDRTIDGTSNMFETMIFPDALVVGRYSTRRHAEAGHFWTVMRVLDGDKPGSNPMAAFEWLLAMTSVPLLEAIDDGST